MNALRFVPAAGLVFVLASCSTVNTVERATASANYNMVDDRRVISDSSLDDYAYVESVNEGRVGGLLMIQAKIANSTSALRRINYKFEWIDKNGMEVPSGASPWMTLILEGGESKNISAVAPSADVCDFKLKLLPNKRD